MGHRRELGITPKDLDVLLFIWKWKLSSTAAVCVRFFHESAKHSGTTYHRLLRLEKLGLVERIAPDSRRGVLWTLSQKGFNEILDDLPTLSERGFASEAVRHDHICQAAHLSLWLPGNSRSHDSLYSEQELRRVHPSNAPEWVPPVHWHRPDGYWRLFDGEKFRIVALEVELSPKTNDSYENTSLFYNESQSVDSVLWIVDGSAIGKRIHSHWTKCGPKNREMYNFVYLKDFIEQGAKAKVVEGSHVRQTMFDFLTSGHPSSANRTPIAAPSPGYSRFIFDTGVYRTKSIPSSLPRPSTNSLTVSPSLDSSATFPSTDHKGVQS